MPFRGPSFSRADLQICPAGFRVPRRALRLPMRVENVEELSSRSSTFAKAQEASVLVGLLWCLALLSLMVVGVLHTASLDLRVVKNHGDEIQAHYLALAGIEKAKALLYQDAIDRRRSRAHHQKQLYDAPEHFRDIPLGRGQFKVFRQGGWNNNQPVIYGITDEESRLNVNQANAEELAKLSGMTPEAAAAIIDYRDEDNEVTQGGAEAEEYAALVPPYLPRNGPLLTLRELAMARGISPELLLGEDANQNGLLDPEENDGAASFPPDNQDGFLDAGWSGLITVDSEVQNINAAGESRINVQEASENSLAAVPGISDELAKAIVEYRKENRLESLPDLLDVTPPGRRNSSRANDGPENQDSPSRQSPQPAQNSSSTAPGEKLISEDLLMEIADDLTTDSDITQPGAINLNTAEAEVLMCLSGMTRELAQAIVAQRQSDGFFRNPAELLKVPGISRQLFKQIAPRVSVRSDTFRILSEGTVLSTGARKRIQVIVRVGRSSVDTLSIREDNL